VRNRLADHGLTKARRAGPALAEHHLGEAALASEQVVGPDGAMGDAHALEVAQGAEQRPQHAADHRILAHRGDLRGARRHEPAAARPLQHDDRLADVAAVGGGPVDHAPFGRAQHMGALQPAHGQQRLLAQAEVTRAGEREDGARRIAGVGRGKGRGERRGEVRQRRAGTNLVTLGEPHARRGRGFAPGRPRFAIHDLPRPAPRALGAVKRKMPKGSLTARSLPLPAIA